MKLRTKIVFDSNIWISYIIGRRLQDLVSIIQNNELQVFTCSTMITEIKDVLNRPKFRKYISVEDIDEAVIIHQKLTIEHNSFDIRFKTRDTKDDFLFGLSESTSADYLISGDNDVLQSNHTPPPTLLTLKEFTELL